MMYQNSSKEIASRSMPAIAALIAGPYIVTLTCLGILVNTLVIVTFRRHQRLLNSNNLLVMLLALTDLLIASLSFPLIAASSIANRWLFAAAGCVWYGMSMTSLSLTSISLLTCIALERYIVIAVVQRQRQGIAKSRARKFAIGCFFWGIVIGLCPLFGWGSYDFEPVFPSCTPVWWRRDPNNLSFVFTIFSVFFFIPMCIISVSYLRIFIKVRKNRQMPSKEIRVAIISLTMIVFFLLSWGPYAVVAFLQAFSHSFHVTDTLNIIPVMMAKTSVLWNPIIYLCKNRKFQRALFDDIVKLKQYFVTWKQTVVLKYLSKSSSRKGTFETGALHTIASVPKTSAIDSSLCIFVERETAV